MNTVTNAVEHYIETSKFRLKPATIGAYRRHLSCHIAPFFGDTPYETVTSEVAQKFVNKLIEENGLSVNTAQSVFNLLRATILSDTGTKLAVKMPKRSKTIDDSLSVGEQKRIEQAAKLSRNIDNYVGIMLCLYTGIRIGEACGLLWSDINFERKRLNINRTIQRICSDGDTKTVIAFLTPKSDTSERTIPIPDFLLDILRDFKATSKTDYVLSYKGKPIEPRTMQNRFKKILETAGVRDVNFHMTRHCFANRALERGFDIKTLSSLLGHSSPSVTLNFYAHSTFEHKQKCMNSLSAVYSA